jgi:hypothetical protein
MRCLWILLGAGLAGGCATQRQMMPTAPVASASPVVRESPTTKLVETRYEIRSYRDADSPGVRHEAHAVYRATRVPARVAALETEPRTTFAPVSYAPLPPSAELSAELATQREITTELRTVQARMVAIEQQAKTQYGTLTDQTAAAVKLRQQLETERARLQEIEAQQHGAVSAPRSADPAVASNTNW